MHHIKQHISDNRGLAALFTVILLAVLTACGTLIPAVDSSDSDRFDLVTSVSIDETISRADLETSSGGTVVSYHPEAGFAILAFQKGQGDLALMSTADANQDVIGTPEANANGWTAWSGGWTAWSGGWTVWSGGVDSSSTFGENLLAWDQIKLPQGRLVAPNLGAGVRVAVIDTGVSLNHPAFDGRLAPASEWMDFVDGDTYPMDEPGGNGTGHGTAVAGVILQVAPNVTILPIRVLAADGSGDVDNVIEGIDHAIAMGADVINLSLGTDVDLGSLKKMIEYATDHEDLVVASLGNEDSTDITYPARHAKNVGLNNYLIGVGSVDQVDVKASFSNYGFEAELFTPGEGIYTVTRSDTEEALATNATGTSFSAPMVAGAVILALGESPANNQRQLIHNMLNVSAKDLEPGNPQYPGQIGHGGLNIERFLEMMQYDAPVPVMDALLVIDQPISSSDRFIEDRLELLGFGVTTIDDDAASSNAAAAMDVVVISHSVSSGDVNSIFRDVAVPVITWEDAIFDDMGMSTSARSDVDDYETVTIATEHPLAVGCDGDTTVYQGQERLAYGTPSSSAITVATVPGQPEKAVIFAYEGGAQMVGMEAPAKRMGFFFQNYNALKFDFRSVTLFDAAVLWSSYDGSVNVVASGGTYLEAVNYSALEGSFDTVAGTSLETNSYMAVTQGIGKNYDGANTQARLHYDLTIPAPGSYHLWLRVFGPDSGSDSFYVQLDGGGNTVLHFGSQGSWLWKKVDGSVFLDGDHTLTIAHREDGARLDRILITSDASFTPSGMGGN